MFKNSSSDYTNRHEVTTLYRHRFPLMTQQNAGIIKCELYVNGRILVSRHYTSRHDSLLCFLLFQVKYNCRPD